MVPLLLRRELRLLIIGDQKNLISPTPTPNMQFTSICVNLNCKPLREPVLTEMLGTTIIHTIF